MGRSALRHSGKPSSRRRAIRPRRRRNRTLHRRAGSTGRGSTPRPRRRRAARAAPSEAFDGNRSGTGDVAGREFGGRAHIDHDDVAGGDPCGQLGSSHLVQFVAVSEIRGGEIVEFGVMGGSDVAQCRPQVDDAVGDQAVVDPVLVAARDDQADTSQGAQMERGVGDALVDLVGEFFHVAFALGEHVDQFGAASVRQGFGDVREPVEQCVFCHSVSHGAPSRSSNNHLTR
jgi:hypothetical protein